MRLCQVLIINLILFSRLITWGQLPSINNWREHLPYSRTIQVADGADKIWCATPFSIFSIDKDENSIDRWATTNGLSETGICCISWNNSTGTLLIAYSNSNIDLLTDGTVKNISAIKNSTQSGNKTIYRAFSLNNLVYLSTVLGIIVIDVPRKEVKDTYIIGSNGDRIKVNAVSADNNFLYAATTEGLKRASITNQNLSDYRNWQQLSGSNGLSGGEVSMVVNAANDIIVCRNDTLYIQSGNNWNLLYGSVWKIKDITVSGNKLVISETQSSNGRVILLNKSGVVEQVLQNNSFTRLPKQALLSNNQYWIADSLAGLSTFASNNFQSYTPNSPYSIASGEMVIFKENLWVAAGSVNSNWQPVGNKDGLFHFSDNAWKNFNSTNAPAFDTLPDIITVAIDRRDGTLWGGSYGGGLFSIANNTVSVIKRNSPLQSAVFDPNSYRVSGLAFDEGNNLWISNYGAANNLHVKKADGNWRSFSIPFPLIDLAAGQIVIDDLQQKWIIAPREQGLICFNDGNSIDNTSDDRWRWYRAGQGNGNLPDNDVRCIVKDKNSFIWVGTKQGIGIIQCPQEVFTNQGCEALLPVVQQDNFAGYLFRDEEVQTIAIDGADRKWIGTRNGAWLISADGDKTIYRFNTANSPLPDNDVKKIIVDPVTGEVFISTAKGIVSFRGTATEGTGSNTNVLVYPNPVPPGYSGTIAIRGLVNNAIVKITELDGRLVYQTRALGGQAIWNGKNYKGQQVATGVYLVLINDDGKQEKAVTKIVFVNAQGR